MKTQKKVPIWTGGLTILANFKFRKDQEMNQTFLFHI